MGLWACPSGPEEAWPLPHRELTPPKASGLGRGLDLLWSGWAGLCCLLGQSRNPHLCPDFRQPGSGSHGPLHPGRCPAALFLCLRRVCWVSSGPACVIERVELGPPAGSQALAVWGPGWVRDGTGGQAGGASSPGLRQQQPGMLLFFPVTCEAPEGLGGGTCPPLA